MEQLPVVMVVEDDQDIQNVVEDALIDGGFEAAMVSSGERAVALLQGDPDKYQALVADIALRGGIDGWQVAKRAREIDPEFRVIYLTGANAHQWASRGVPNSILLCKPFAPSQLVTAVSSLLNTPMPPA